MLPGLVSSDDLPPNATFSRHAIKFVMTNPANTPIDPHRSNAEPWQMALAEKKALFSIAVLVSEKLRCVKRWRGTKSCTQAIVPLTFWWLTCTPLRQTEKMAGESTENLITCSFIYKICNHKHHKYRLRDVLHMKLPNPIMPYNPKADTNSIYMVARTDTRLAATEGDNMIDGGKHTAILVYLSLLAQKWEEFCFSFAHFTAFYPARTEKLVHKLPKKVKCRVIISPNNGLRRETAKALSKKSACCNSR